MYYRIFFITTNKKNQISRRKSYAFEWMRRCVADTEKRSSDGDVLSVIEQTKVHSHVDAICTEYNHYGNTPLEPACHRVRQRHLSKKPLEMKEKPIKESRGERHYRLLLVFQSCRTIAKQIDKPGC